MEKFVALTNANFVVHMTPLEAKLYGDRVLELLGRARATLCQKYGVQLTQPTAVEIFPDQKDFAVRTFGMPGNPGYLGVCFGSVITANSPASQAPNPANWEDVLWHEFCHVVTLTDSKNRMPRWLSEGISVYEERQANPAWGEHMNLAYRRMILDGQLTPLGELSGAFLQPKNGESLQFAYYESSLVVEYIVQQYGLDTLKLILLDLRDGRQINDAIAARTVPLPKLEKQFAAFVQDRAENLAPKADLEEMPSGISGMEARIWERVHPGNYYVRLHEARELMEKQDWTGAKPILEALAAAYHGERRAENPLWLEAVVERNLNDTNAEWSLLQNLATEESDFMDLDLRLIDLASARKDWPAEEKYAQQLLQIDPLISAPWRALAEAGVALDQKDIAIDAYRKLLLLDPPNPVDAHFRLAGLLHARGGAENEAKRQVLEALEDAPRYREAQRLLLEIEAASKEKGS
jgi:tetratricopeptide (TPR) repeat protein